MPDYAYKAADANGAVVKGIKYANNERELAVSIKATGLHLLEANETKAQQFLKSLEGFSIGGISRRTLVEFSNNMGVMFRAGVPLINALDELRQDQDSKFFQKVLAGIIADIQSGDSLADAMGKRPGVFPKLYVSVVQIGANTGGLDRVFFDLARHYKRIDDLVKNVRKAMAYPAFVVVALIVAAFVFLTLVFPPLFQLLEDFKVPLPMVTRVVMAVSSALRDHWLLFLVGLVVLVGGFFTARKFPTTKYYIDWVELNFPGIRNVFIQLRLAFFMRYLSMVLTAGMDILRGLELAIESVNNMVIQEGLRAAREKVIGGEFLSKALRQLPFIPNMVSRMISIGEEAGNLPDQMEYVADYYNEELERRIAMALTLLEPILLFLLAGLALALVMGVLLPLYNLVSQLSTGVGTGTNL